MVDQKATETSESLQITTETVKKASPFYLAIKRVFDLVIALVGLIVSSPAFLVIAVIIKCNDHGPVFYKQMRVGLNRKPLGLYKFRTMRVDSDKLENMLTPEQLEQYRREFKLDDDPRITKIGKVLRTTSLDELPQLLNVLKGNLSLIGPRPILDDELKMAYTPEEQQRFCSVKPGLTGYWQAYARNNVTYESGERQRMELYYIDNISVGLDIKILFKTVSAVIKKTGSK